MRRKSSTYRFFCSLLATAVFFGSVVPSGLHGKALAYKISDLFTGEQTAQFTKSCCCDSSGDMQRAEEVKNEDREQNSDCQIIIACPCCVGEAPVQPEANPVFQTNVLSAFSLPVTEIGQRDPPAFLTSNLGDKFLKASEHSPPIFLMNSTFLN